jgi:hypothetical protein
MSQAKSNIQKSIWIVIIFDKVIVGPCWTMHRGGEVTPHPLPIQIHPIQHTIGQNSPQLKRLTVEHTQNP